MDISLRPVSSGDLPVIDGWASGIGTDYLSRTHPFDEAALGHDPGSGLYWYVITENGADVGTIWIEVLPAGSEAVLGVFLSDPSLFGRGIGTASVRLAVAAFRRERPRLAVVLRVRRANARAIACYRSAGFAVTGTGEKVLPSGERVAFCRMELTGP